MRINGKDFASALLLLALAGLGLWLNTDHTLGSARRMGPGYMPMLTFGLEFLLGLAVLGISLFSGPDPLERWTKIDFVGLFLGVAVGLVAYPVLVSVAPALGNNWYALGIAMMIGFGVMAISPGWRKMALILAGMTVFGVLLDRGGLFLAIAAMVVIAALADPEHRPLGVLGSVVFLIVVCWWVFIYELDIRVNIWPTF
ncbi:hypothetical protein QMO56_14690 [Roseomonas sp. E05]|uniref:hypothetical protein n=1 Tax=Roseomonas sp. E05 TaxID=3046310 RepID=UPI0024B8A340|nr:hypothetical protein [Roseomonas sp. E05]MDJ0389365.1 hypothetical protein [Roseomonas sp. E05]